MSTASNTQPSPPIFGTTASEFGKGVTQGQGIAKQGQAAIIGSFKFAKAIGQLVYWSIFLLLTGVSGCSILFLRGKIGLITAIMITLLSFLTMAWLGPNITTIQAGIVMLGWWILMIALAFAHIMLGVHRLFFPLPMHEHIHRWSFGEPAAWLEYLWGLLPSWINQKYVVQLQEPILLVIVAVGLWMLDSLVLAEDPEHTSALYLIPLSSAASMILLAALDRVVSAYQGQLHRDMLLDQQSEAERMNKIQGSMHEREAEGYVQLG